MDLVTRKNRTQLATSFSSVVMFLKDCPFAFTQCASERMIRMCQKSALEKITRIAKFQPFVHDNRVRFDATCCKFTRSRNVSKPLKTPEDWHLILLR